MNPVRDMNVVYGSYFFRNEKCVTKSINNDGNALSVPYL